MDRFDKLGNAGIVIIAVFVGIGLMGVLYYVSTLAKNVYAIKLQMKDDLAYEVGKMQDFVEKEMAQRQKWIIRDLSGASDDKLDALQADLKALRTEIARDTAEMREKMQKLAALQQALAARQAKPQPSREPAMEPAFKAESPGRKNAV